MPSHRSMLLGLLLGAVLGLVINAFFGGHPAAEAVIRYGAEPVGRIFLRLLFMLVVPLLVSAIVLGVGGLELEQLGRMGGRLLGYTVVVSTISVAIGMALVRIIRPGASFDRAVLEAVTQSAAVEQRTGSLSLSPVDLIVGMVPDNPLKAAASGDMLALIVFSIVFGLGLAATKTPAAARVTAWFQGIYDVSLTIISGVLHLAPLGVFALILTTTAQLGLSAIRPIGLYVLVVVLGLGLQMYGVYSVVLRFFCNTSPKEFFLATRDAATTAFATSSSNATLPTALRVADEELRLPEHVSRLVLTAGASMNQNGTALFEGVTVLFLAQAYGVELSVVQQILVMVICVLAGIGTAGVPAGSLPVIASILGMVGVPPESIGLVLGVDRFLDMCRTTLNVVGDLVAAVFIARAEQAEET